MTCTLTLRPLCLEDLRVGDVFVSRAHLLDEEQIIHFASQFDPQPFHIDTQTAKGTFFQGLAASGWHTAAITMRLLVESVPLESGIIGSKVELAWTQPARPGDALSVKSTISSITPSRSKPGRVVIVVETITSNQHGDVLQTLTSRLIALSRSLNQT